MKQLMIFATLGTLFIACGRADGPVAPSAATIDVAVAGTGGALYTGHATAVDAA